MTTGKTIALTRQTFVGKVISLLLNMLSRLVITFLGLVVLKTFLETLKVKVTQSSPTLCDPMNCSLPGSSVHGILQARIQGIFPSQGLNPGLPHCRQILYHLSHQGSPRILQWVAYPFSRGSSWPRNGMGVSCITGGFFTSCSIRGAHSKTLHHIKVQIENSWKQSCSIKIGIPLLSFSSSHSGCASPWITSLEVFPVTPKESLWVWKCMLWCKASS